MVLSCHLSFIGSTCHVGVNKNALLLVHVVVAPFFFFFLNITRFLDLIQHGMFIFYFLMETIRICCWCHQQLWEMFISKKGKKEKKTLHLGMWKRVFFFLSSKEKALESFLSENRCECHSHTEWVWWTALCLKNWTEWGKNSNCHSKYFPRALFWFTFTSIEIIKWNISWRSLKAG